MSDWKANSKIKQQTERSDVVESVAQLKWNWADHVTRTNDDWWTKRTMEWLPRGHRNCGAQHMVARRYRGQPAWNG